MCIKRNKLIGMGKDPTGVVAGGPKRKHCLGKTIAAVAAAVETDRKQSISSLVKKPKMPKSNM